MDSIKPGISITDSSQMISRILDTDEINLRELLDTLIEGRWLALSVACFVLLLGITYAKLATPVYRADAVLQVEERKAAIPGLDDLSAILEGGSAKSLAEIEIVRSRTVIGKVVHDLGLDITASPRRMRLVGNAIARRYEPGQITNAWPGFRRYSWSGERAVVSRLAVPEKLEGTRLTLEVGENDTYKLYDEDGRLLLTGQVGKAAEKRTDSGAVSIFIRELFAAPGAQFFLTKHPFNSVVERIQKSLKVSERGKQTGILQVALEGHGPQEIVDIVNGVVNAYLRQNVERHSEEASHMLTFLDAQLPELKRQLDTAEAALREYKSRTGSAVDISAEGEEMLRRATDVEKQISELELQRSEMRQRFTDQHPLMVVLQQKVNQVRQTSAALNTQFKNLPETELQSIRLVRNVKVANELYVQLLNRAQELKVAKAGTIGNARVLDPAIVPRKPVSPKQALIIALSLLLGLVAGAAAVLLHKSLGRTLDNPERIETELGLPIYTTIPHSRAQKILNRESRHGSLTSSENQLLCRSAPQEPAVESLRSLRTSLQFALLEAKNNIVSIHGPTPEIGKSFVASNLAFLMADVGKRVLLIDADMRKGHMHSVLGSERTPGLADVIAGQVVFSDAVHKFGNGNIGFLTTGTLPPNPAELLSHGKFTTLLGEASQQYDFVIVDTPPTLNLADSISIGRLSGTNFMVVRGGQNTLTEVQIACRRLQQSGIVVNGIIFNDLSVTKSRYRYGGYYAYHYTPQGKSV